MGTIISAPDDVARSQLLQLAEIIKLVSKAGDIARMDIANPPPSTGIGNGTWTRVTGVLTELEAMIAIYRQLGGPELPSSVETFAIDCRRMGTPATNVVGESMSILSELTGLAQNFTGPANAVGWTTVSGQAG
jgi:hypothetical protein